MIVAALEGASFRRGTHRVLDRVDLQVEAGQRIALLGPNGAGKTTALRLLLALESPSSGVVRPCGRGAGYVPQRYAESLFPWFSVSRNVALYGLLARHADAERSARALCERLLPGVDANRRAGELSGGEQQAAAIARALAAPGDVVVADEPFSALSERARRRAGDVLRDELRGRALLLVTHSPQDARDLCDRILTLEDGRLVEGRG